MPRRLAHIILLYLCSALPVPAVSGQDEAVPLPVTRISSYQLRDGTLLGIHPGSATLIDLKGRVECIYETTDLVYYLRRGSAPLEASRENGPAWYAGCLRRGDIAPACEREIPLDPGESEVKKILAHDDAVFILAGAAEGVTPALTRFSLNDGRVERRDGVVDVCIAHEKLLLLEQENGSLRLNFNGNMTPLMMKGAARINLLLRDRLAVISGDEGHEIIDILLMKNLYQFSSGPGPRLPDEYNLLFEAVEKEPGDRAPDTETMVFYKIFIDGNEEGRTETGLKSLMKSFRVSSEPGRFHVIQAERWELDKWKKQYFRANNVYQPGAVRIFIPENRIIRLFLEYDGQEFRFRQDVVLEDSISGTDK